MKNNPVALLNAKFRNHLEPSLANAKIDSRDRPILLKLIEKMNQHFVDAMTFGYAHLYEMTDIKANMLSEVREYELDDQITALQAETDILQKEFDARHAAVSLYRKELTERVTSIE